MKILAPCFECTFSSNPRFESQLVDYFDDGVAFVTCSVGHKFAAIVQAQKFEILLNSGASALLDGFTLEACASFSAALERFYEFFIRSSAKGRKISTDLFDEMFKTMAQQSERQFGAFLMLYLLEFKKAYKENPKIRTFRNKVIHKGEIPKNDKATEFCSWVYDEINKIYQSMSDKCDNFCLQEVTMEMNAKRQKNVPNGMRVAIVGETGIFPLCHKDQKGSFDEALEAFQKSREMLRRTVIDPFPMGRHCHSE
ncbi:hypothetical protein [Acetobacter sicerae]|uniref:hypothetical protein n=1 Tax=Acetobacter sicerae TaxID=85325 RepID=UPI00156B8783|nr:hypothetical protein [Acetobacter sicerae]NHN90372.1 hypothetical protein [Acetobacter sicerae]